jgi:fructose-1-phosphate kinase PfkB-like protein
LNAFHGIKSSSIVFVYQSEGQATAIRDDGWLVAQGNIDEVLEAANSEAREGKIVLGPGTWPATIQPGVKYVGTHRQPSAWLTDMR